MSVRTRPVRGYCTSPGPSWPAPHAAPQGAGGVGGGGCSAGMGTAGEPPEAPVPSLLLPSAGPGPRLTPGGSAREGVHVRPMADHQLCSGLHVIDAAEFSHAACCNTSYSCIPQRSWTAQHPAGVQVAPGHPDPPTAHASPRLVIGWPLRCSPSPRSYPSRDVASAARTVKRHRSHEVVDSRPLTYLYSIQSNTLP